ncbi:MAG: hypothetical protein ACM3QX_18375 [Syntrophomonadaceae bacterium]
MYYYIVTDTITGKSRVYDRDDLLYIYYNEPEVLEALTEIALSFTFSLAIHKRKSVNLIFELL